MHSSMDEVSAGCHHPRKLDFTNLVIEFSQISCKNISLMDENLHSNGVPKPHVYIMLHYWFFQKKRARNIRATRS